MESSRWPSTDDPPARTKIYMHAKVDYRVRRYIDELIKFCVEKVEKEIYYFHEPVHRCNQLFYKHRNLWESSRYGNVVQKFTSLAILNGLYHLTSKIEEKPTSRERVSEDHPRQHRPVTDFRIRMQTRNARRSRSHGICLGGRCATDHPFRFDIRHRSIRAGILQAHRPSTRRARPRLIPNLLLSEMAGEFTDLT